MKEGREGQKSCSRVVFLALLQKKLHALLKIIRRRAEEAVGLLEGMLVPQVLESSLTASPLEFEMTNLLAKSPI